MEQLKINEIFLTKKYVSQEEWIQLFNTITKYNGMLTSTQIILYIEDNKINYYIKTKCSLPPVINGLPAFIFREANFEVSEVKRKRFYQPDINYNIVDIKNKLEITNKGKLKYAIITLKKGFNKLRFKTKIIVEKKGILVEYKLLLNIPSNILSVDFNGNYNLSYKGAPKYLDINKCINILNDNATSSIVKVDTFPYLQGSYYLGLNSYNFAVHSVIIGASGSGKSKFIASFINNIYKNPEFLNNYRVVLIDPHAALESEIGGIGQVIDFKSNKNSLNLFHNNSEDAIVSVELLLDLFKGLIGANYNSKLERVMRHSIYLLLIDDSFNFTNLRKVILDLDFRNELIMTYKRKLPTSIIDFFQTEFGDLKNKSYGEAISPIIAFIDEMELLPVFNNENVKETLASAINENFLNIISLDRTKLGDSVTKTIAGLVMQQLFTMLQNYTFDRHIIFIVDEVAVIYNPILTKFLSEARKYSCSCILAGQYFNQINEDLKESIFANVINYYMFRVSQIDATQLVKIISMKVPLVDTEEQKIKIFTDLKNRECIIRINNHGTLLPALKGITTDFKSIPRIINNDENSEIISDSDKLKRIKFSIGNVDMRKILETSSSSRKVDFNE